MEGIRKVNCAGSEKTKSEKRQYTTKHKGASGERHYKNNSNNKKHNSAGVSQAKGLSYVGHRESYFMRRVCHASLPPMRRPLLPVPPKYIYWQFGWTINLNGHPPPVIYHTNTEHIGFTSMKLDRFEIGGFSGTLTRTSCGGVARYLARTDTSSGRAGGGWKETAPTRSGPFKIWQPIG